LIDVKADWPIRLRYPKISIHVEVQGAGVPTSKFKGAPARAVVEMTRRESGVAGPMNLIRAAAPNK
jgi:hypothetical protein